MLWSSELSLVAENVSAIPGNILKCSFSEYQGNFSRIKTQFNTFAFESKMRVFVIHLALLFFVYFKAQFNYISILFKTLK